MSSFRLSLQSLGYASQSPTSSSVEDHAEPGVFSLHRNSIHALAILSNLNEQRKNASHYCDSQIVTSDGRDFYFHKLIMDIFTDLFDDCGRFTTEEIDSECMSVFFEYIYAGTQPAVNHENAIKLMRSSIKIRILQITRITVEYCVSNLFEVLHSDYFSTLSFPEINELPIFEESLVLDKLRESKYRKVIRKWVSQDPDTRLSSKIPMEKLFSKLWTVDDHERALAVSVNVLGISNIVQFNQQDGKWYHCEYSCKPTNVCENCLQNVLQMGLYKKDYFLFRDDANNVYCSSSELKRIWNRSTTLGTFVAGNCTSLKQIQGQVYAFFDCLKKWNGDTKKFDAAMCKDLCVKQNYKVVDFTLDDRNGSIYLLGSFDKDEGTHHKMGILTVRDGESPLFVSMPEYADVDCIITAGDDHLLVYKDTSTHVEGHEGSKLYVYDPLEKSFPDEWYSRSTLDPSAGLFRLNNKLYSVQSTDGAPEQKFYRCSRFYMKVDEEPIPYKFNIGENQTFIKGVCISPSKGYHSIVYGVPEP